MNTQELGNTGERIPDVGLGTWAYTGGSAPLRRGVELGAFLIDTAEAYRTEDAVGDAMEGIRADVFVATKVSPSHFRRRDVLRAADESLRRLRCGVIDLYQLHWPNPRIPIAETMGAVQELVDAGKVRHVGVSNFSVAEMEEARAALPNAPIVSNQVEYSLTDRSIEAETLPYCQANGITVIAYSPLARGLGNFGKGAEGAGRRGRPQRPHPRPGRPQLVPVPRRRHGHPQDQRRRPRRGKLRRLRLVAPGRGHRRPGNRLPASGAQAAVRLLLTQTPSPLGGGRLGWGEPPAPARPEPLEGRAPALPPIPAQAGIQRPLPATASPVASASPWAREWASAWRRGPGECAP